MSTKEQVDTLQQAINILLDVEVRIRYVRQVEEALNLIMKVGRELAIEEKDDGIVAK